MIPFPLNRVPVRNRRSLVIEVVEIWHAMVLPLSQTRSYRAPTARLKPCSSSQRRSPERCATTLIGDEEVRNANRGRAPPRGVLHICKATFANSLQTCYPEAMSRDLGQARGCHDDEDNVSFYGQILHFIQDDRLWADTEESNHERGMPPSIRQWSQGIAKTRVLIYEGNDVAVHRNR